MTLSVDQIRLAPGGHIYTAATSTANPTDVTTAWAVGWKEHGYASDEGVSLAPKISTGNVPVWQSAAPGKHFITGIELSLEFALHQVNEDNLGLYFFGATWTAGETSKLVIPSSPVLDTRKLGIEWTDDGGFVNRLIVQRGLATDREKVVLNRKTAQAYGITFEAQDFNGELAHILSNNPDLGATED